MKSEIARQPGETTADISVLVAGCGFLLIGLALAGYGLVAFLGGAGGYEQSNTWLGLFTAVGGGQLLATYALTTRGIPEFDFWQVRSVLPPARQRDRLLVLLQIPFQAGAFIGVALYVMFSPGGYVPTFLLALSVAVVVVCWNTYRARATASAPISLYVLAAAMLLRFIRIMVG